jgi:hypothetical protein
MANQFVPEPVNALQALLMQERGADAGFQQQMRPLQMQQQRQQMQARDQLQQLLQAGGTPDMGKLAIGMLASGDTAGAGVLANMVNQQSQRAFQERSINLQEQAANRRDIPSGFRAGADGGLAPIPGGPADPAYLGAKTNATEKPRNMSVGDVTKLQEEGGKFANLTGFARTFKDDYVQSVVGDLRNRVTRAAPDALTPDAWKESAGWWQGYDRFKNVVRNDLFGSALTKPETEAFEKADVNPGMNPTLIRQNLKIQAEIAERGLKKKAQALISEGYRPDTISAAYGVKLEDLGVAPQRGVKTPAAGQISEGRTATNPQTGEKRVYRGGQWVPVQ